EYVDGRPMRIDTVVLSAQHTEDVDLTRIREDLQELVLEQVVPAKMLDRRSTIHVNPTGRFVLGGPRADAGVTGRKIIVDSYGGYARHGGGCFSGKDPSKVDRPWERTDKADLLASEAGVQRLQVVESQDG